MQRSPNLAVAYMKNLCCLFGTGGGIKPRDHTQLTTVYLKNGCDGGS